MLCSADPAERATHYSTDSPGADVRPGASPYCSWSRSGGRSTFCRLGQPGDAPGTQRNIQTLAPPGSSRKPSSSTLLTAHYWNPLDLLCTAGESFSFQCFARRLKVHNAVRLSGQPGAHQAHLSTTHSRSYKEIRSNKRIYKARQRLSGEDGTAWGQGRMQWANRKRQRCKRLFDRVHLCDAGRQGAPQGARPNWDPTDRAPRGGVAIKRESQTAPTRCTLP